ncbi:MAG TPA: glycosyl hydrolase 53 family protein [Chitinophagaceae bacterium]|nr:glycosyl hydrolase 53 family protein [Chitinophagaceae bacterium]
MKSFIIFLLLLTVVFGCKKKKEDDTQTTTGCDRSAGHRRGFAFSPFGFPSTYDNSTAFFQAAENFGNTSIMWNGNWRDSLASSGTLPSAPVSITQNTSYCYLGYSVFGWRSGSTLYLDHPASSVNNWTNSYTQAAMKNMLVQFAQTYQPKYLFIGNENDFFYVDYPSNYASWISFYETAYDAIKAVSPDTLVGVVFNYEHMSGHGSLNAWTTSYWGAYTAHNASKIDIVGITTYPFFDNANASSIPSTYYNDLFSHIGTKPIAITETGWSSAHATGYTPSWNASTTQQTDFISKLSTLLSGRDVRFVNWLYLNTMTNYCSSCDAWKIFGNVSLVDSSGVEKPAFAAWKSFTLQ